MNEMLEYLVLDSLTSQLRGGSFEFDGNIYSIRAMMERQRELFAKIVEPYMVAQEVVDITEKSD